MHEAPQLHIEGLLGRGTIEQDYFNGMLYFTSMPTSCPR